MKRFIDWPINRKLSTIVLSVAGVLVITITVAVTVERHITFRKNLRENTEVLSRVIGINSTAALVFNDQTTATEILSALRAEKTILCTNLFDAQKKLFASYHNPHCEKKNHASDIDACPSCVFTLDDFSENEARFTKRYFLLIRPIVLGKKTIGYISLLADLAPLNKQELAFGLLLLLLSLILFIAALATTFRLNRSLIQPITLLAKTMQQIGIDQKYTVRVPKKQEDELGLLIDGFNDMLSQIEKRDNELADHRHRLTHLVNRQTKKLKQANKLLLEEIEERKAAQNQLAHAQKMEAIGTLAGGVAHDLNNILSGVVGYPDLLLANLPEDSPMFGPLTTIKTSGKKAAAIVQDLLTLARRGVKVEENIELSSLILDYLESAECIEMLRNHPNVEVRFPKPTVPVYLTGSPIHLSKMVMNLVSNAAEAMPDGGKIDITCTIWQSDHQPAGFTAWRPGPYASLTITDYGIGIPQKYIDKIFEPFYSRKVMGRSGTGLGMSVVWGTVQDHKGHITVQSTESQGTTFHILLPIADNMLARQDRETLESPEQGHGELVLVVDDAEDQRLIAADLLSHLKYSCHTVESGEAAVAYLLENKVDIVLLDMLMEPGIDGLETYRQIQKIHPQQKAIIISGFSSSERVDEALKLGVREYLFKPYTLPNLARALHDTLHDKT